MDRHKGRKIALQVFLSGLFALLVTYIGFWVYDIVIRTGSFVGNESHEDPAFTCVEYIFDANQGTYENGKLTFMFTNKHYSGYPISELVIVTDTGQTDTVNLGRLTPGKSKVVEAEIEMESIAKVFPVNCDVYGKIVEMG